MVKQPEAPEGLSVSFIRMPDARVENGKIAKSEEVPIPTRSGGRVARGIPRGFAGNDFRSIREGEVDMRITTLARRSGVGVSTIAAWEASRRSPQIDKLRAALKVLEIPAGRVIHVNPKERTLADWRALRLLLQPELARMIGIRTPHLSLIESAAMELTPDMRSKLATALELSEEEVSASWQRRKDADD